MYIQLIGRIEALPWVAADTMPPVRASPPAALRAPSPASAGTEYPRGRNGARCALTAHGPTPGPPPPWGIQKVLCRLRWLTSEPHLPGRARPTSAFMLAPSVYTWPPC